MKRIGILSGLALAALALTNCSTKEIEVPAEVAAGKEGVPFEIIALPSVETRTVAGEGLTTVWDATNDVLSVFHRTANTGSFTNDGEFSVADAETGTFSGTISENVPVSGNSYDWVAIYPYSSYLLSLADPVGEQGGYYYIGCNSQKAQLQDGTGSNAHLAGYKSDNTGNFPLWGKAEDVAYNASASGVESPAISMNQVASVLAFNITNSTSEAISVSSIEFTATEDIVGAYYIDFTGTTPAFTPYNNYQSATAKLEVTNGTIAAGGSGTFYMGIKPFTVEGTAAEPKTLSMKVTTELGDTQVKTFNVAKTMTFSPNKFKNVNMVWNTEHVGDVIPEEPDTDDYVLVENLSNVTSGYYLIVNYDPVNVEDSYILKNDQLTSKTQSAVTLDDISGLTISSDEKIITTDANNIKWCFIAHGLNEFKIKSAAAGSNYYLLCKMSDNDGLRIASWNYSGWQNYWTVVEKDLDPSEPDYKTFFLTTTVDDVTRYLATYTSKPDWRTYTTSAQAWNYIRLYKKGTPLPPSGIGFSTPSYEFTLNDADYTAFTGQPLTNPNNVSVTWSSSNTTLATVSNGTVTFVPNKTGETTISAKFAGNQSFKSETVSYTITVNPNSAGLGLPFNETFTGSTGTMGWSGGAASGTINYDNEGWESENASGADGAAKFGTGSKLGTATTPAISYSGNATLSFKAGAWNGNSESTTLKLSISTGSGTIYSDADLTTTTGKVTMVKGDWTTYTVYLKDLVGPFAVTFEGDKASNSRFLLDDVSIVAGIEQPAASFGASISNTDIVLAAGGNKTINVTGNVSWAASATNNATVSPSSGTGVGSVTVTIPENETSSEKTYSVTISTSAEVDPDSYSFTITQEAAPSVVNESTESDPYTPAEAAALADELSGATLDDVYVYGIIKSANYYTSSNTWNLVISADGSSEGSQFTIYKAAGEDFVAGDAVEFKGTLKKYNSTAELDEGNTLIAQLHKPTISPNGGSFTTSQSVSIAVNTSTTGATGAAIHYTTDGNDPTASSATYTSAFSISETTTVKAVATKGVLITGVTSATFTKNSGKTNQVLFHETFGNNSGSARAWNDSYSVKSGVNAVYSAITGYTVTNAKQSKNTVGSVQSGLLQTTTGSDAVLIIGPLAVADAENMVLTYQWNAGSIKKTYSTKLYYATSSSGTYSEIGGTGSGATSFVTRSYTLPVAAQVNTLYLKIVWNTSNVGAIIDEVNLQGDY